MSSSNAPVGPTRIAAGVPVVDWFDPLPLFVPPVIAIGHALIPCAYRSIDPGTVCATVCWSGSCGAASVLVSPASGELGGVLDVFSVLSIFLTRSLHAK